MTSPITVVVYDEGAQGASQLGGGQIARIALLAALDRSAFRPILLTSREGELAAAAQSQGVEVVVRDINARCPRVLRRDLVRRPLAVARTLWAVGGAARRLAKALDDLDADILHPNENLSRTVALLSRLWRRVPTVIHIDNEWNQGAADVLMRALFLRGFDRLIGVSNRAIEAADPAAKFRHKIALIPTGIDPGRFVGHDRDAVRRDLGFAPDDFVIVTVGRLEALKGQRCGIEAVANLWRESRAPIRYLLVGEGPDRASLLAEAETRGVGDRVRFLGHRHDVPRLLCAADIMLHPSLTEAHPLVVVEGLLAGLPVVATRVGGTAEILDNGRYGELVPAGDAPTMTKALATLVARSPSQRSNRSCDGQKYAKARFGQEEMVGRIAAVYAELAHAVRNR